MNETNLDHFGSKTEALANARRLLLHDALAAAEQCQEIILGDPECAEAYRIQALALRQLSRNGEALQAESIAIELSSLEPTLLEAAMRLADSRLDVAENLIRPHLEKQSDDPVALRLLAEIGTRTGHFDAAERLLYQALSVAPHYEPAKDLLALTRRLRKRQVSKPTHIRATIAVDEGDTTDSSIAINYASALTLYEIAVRRYPNRPDYWVSYGHVLRAIGRRDEAISAYRRAIALQPTFGDPWWGLADLKSDSFKAKDAEEMLRLINAPNADQSDLIKLHFAVGRAFEQQNNFEAAFCHFSIGNQMRSHELDYNRTAITQHVDRSIELFDNDFFSKRKGMGLNIYDPIFIIGMPRSGSTLIEQILSTHPQIEATMELPDITGLANHLGGISNAAFENSPYLEKLAALNQDELHRLGQSYIWSSGLRRTTERPYFIDKMPNNWLHIGLITTILPNARIIDARRHPLDCGVSNFRQLFGQGQGFSYNLLDFANYYSDYIRLMRHVDNILPGHIHRIIHEELIESPESVIQKLLDFVGVPFDEACLRFYENKRAVRTASSEQVRRPLNREGMHQWKRYEPWIRDFKTALEPVLENYPNV